MILEAFLSTHVSGYVVSVVSSDLLDWWLTESSISGKPFKTEEYQTANHRERFLCSTEAISLPIFAFFGPTSNREAACETLTDTNGSQRNVDILMANQMEEKRKHDCRSDQFSLRIIFSVKWS
ncbi:probable G-protein coupled receptor 85 isoform X2 [Papio anubis]|uniref:probable G-protein coupled receptor 85 isoform X2 n=1 Tax=Papio anubis TaxID=9555 RepID=UPI00083F1935|nr:probable G-protein coupled receptor 85 isoform X2 [Papio anubis]